MSPGWASRDELKSRREVEEVHAASGGLAVLLSCSILSRSHS